MAAPLSLKCVQIDGPLESPPSPQFPLMLSIEHPLIGVQSRSAASGTLLSLAFGAMSTKRPSWSKLSQLVTDHFLCDIDTHVRATVVHKKRVPDKFRSNRGPPRPSFDGLLASSFAKLIDFFQELQINIRPLL